MEKEINLLIDQGSILAVKKRKLDFIVRIISVSTLVSITIVAPGANGFFKLPEAFNSLLGLVYWAVPLFFYGLYRFFSKSIFSDPELVGSGIYGYRLVFLFAGIFLGYWAMSIPSYIVMTISNYHPDTSGLELGSFLAYWYLLFYLITYISIFAYLFGTDVADRIYARHVRKRGNGTH